jgi:hypothetical protein
MTDMALNGSTLPNVEHFPPKLATFWMRKPARVGCGSYITEHGPRQHSSFEVLFHLTTSRVPTGERSIETSFTNASKYHS